MKCQKTVRKCPLKFQELELTYLNCAFCPTNGPKPKDI